MALYLALAFCFSDVFLCGIILGAILHAYVIISHIANNKNISFFDAVDLLEEMEGDK